jgi:hypothetical protein
VPIWLSSRLEAFGDEAGLGDLKAGLQAQLGRSGPWVFAVRALAQAPTGDETLAEGLLPTGTGVWEGEAFLSVGRSLAGGKGWAFVDAGHLTRGGKLRDAFLFAGQVGWHLNGRVALTAQVRGVEPYDKSARDVAIGSPTGLSDRVTYTTVGLGAMVKLGGPWTLQVDLEDTPRARNLARGLMLRSGLAFSR